jgi:hypothetical protein
MKLMRTALLLLIFVTGCGKHTTQFQPAAMREDFGPLLNDKAVVIPQTFRSLHPRTYAENEKVIVDSSDWLDLGNELMETKETTLVQMGHNLAKGFYNLSSSSSQITGMTNPPGSPYAEAALTMAQPLMLKKYDDAITHVESMVIASADQVDVSVKDLGADSPPGKLIEKVIIELKLFEEQLLQARDGTGDEIVEKIATSVDSKYIKDLQQLEKAASLDPKTPLSESLKNLELSLTTLEEVSESDRSRLLVQVRYAKNLASQNEKIRTPEDALAFLVDFWLAKDFRRNYPATIRNIFDGLNEAQIFALATDNQAVDPSWPVLKSRTDYNDLTERQITALYLANNGKLLSDSDWQRLKNERQEKLNALLTKDRTVADFSKLIATIPSDDIAEQRFTLIAQWLGLTGRLCFPANLRQAFSSVDEEDLDLVGHNVWLHVQLLPMRYKILFAMDQRNRDSIQKLFTDTIVARTREKVNKAILPVAETLSTGIKEALIPLLEKSRKNATPVVNDNFYNFGRYYSAKYLFGGDLKKGDRSIENADNAVLARHPLPLFEYSKLNFVYSQGRFHEDFSNGLTGAKVIGLGFSALASRLKTYSPYEGDIRSPQAMDLGFEAINKMLAMAGYRDTQDQLVQSLSVSMTPGQESALFNVRKYDPSVIVFAVPDVIRLAKSFKLDSSSRTDPKVSVDGQMELLKGLSRLMGYFKPWKSADFDVGLGSLRIDEDPTIKPFDSADYFLLSLSLAAPILKNIPVRMLGCITSDHRYIDGASDDARSAVVTDYVRDTKDHVVKTSSIALAIFALSDFYEQLKDIELTQEPVLISTFRETPIEGIRTSIERLISGLVLFSSGDLRSSDGGFYSSFDLTEMKIKSSKRNLNDQLLMEEALLKASKTLDSGYIAAKAIDNFYFLNNTMWDGRLGFYSREDDEKKSGLRLLDVARAIKNVKQMSEALTQSSNGIALKSKDSVAQMERLIRFWVSSFFGPDLMALPAPEQVQDFFL